MAVAGGEIDDSGEYPGHGTGFGESAHSVADTMISAHTGPRTVKSNKTAQLRRAGAGPAVGESYTQDGGREGYDNAEEGKYRGQDGHEDDPVLYGQSTSFIESETMMYGSDQQAANAEQLAGEVGQSSPSKFRGPPGRSNKS